MFPGFSVRLRHMLAQYMSLALLCRDRRSPTDLSEGSRYVGGGLSRPRSSMLL